ncbi:hypothetical protein M514_07268 [Trichuris suis]|uniref:Uncharacterized protein n=1 Tax=Trichuris suis TaxID=68888 RepID=A0A085N1J7_9BILA|nr:hypothetical protein M514_07268 [Trichuris suis]
MSSQWYFLNIRDEENAAAFLREKGSVQEKERGLKVQSVYSNLPKRILVRSNEDPFCHDPQDNTQLVCHS